MLDFEGPHYLREGRSTLSKERVGSERTNTNPCLQRPLATNVGRLLIELMRLTIRNLLSKGVRMRPALIIILVAVCGAQMLATRLGPLALVKDGVLWVQDFTCYYLLTDVSNSTVHSSPYMPEARGSRIQDFCREEIRQSCEMSDGIQPVGLSPTGFVGLFGLSKVLGNDLHGALRGHTLLMAGTFCVWLLLGWKVVQLSKHKLFFLFSLTTFLALTSMSPFEAAVIQGQPSFLVVGLVALVMLTERYTRPIIVALTLALTSIKPHYFLLACVLFAAAREWRALSIACIGVLFLGALAAAIYGVSILTEYPAVVRGYASGMTFVWYDNSLNIRHYLPAISNFVTPIGMILGLLISILSIVYGSVTGASLLALIYVFFSPYVPRYELAVLLIPALGLSTWCSGDQKMWQSWHGKSEKVRT